MTTLWKQMKQLDTKFELKNTMCYIIAEWFEIGHILLYKYPEKFHKAIWSQDVKDWRKFFNGKVSRHWLEHQGNTKTKTGQA